MNKTYFLNALSAHRPFINFPAKLISGAALCVMLAACQTTGTNPDSNASRVDSALERAANDAGRGSGGASLPYLEKIYKRNSEDETVAIDYARALREADYLNKAETVLAPFANSGKSTAAAKREYAGIQLALGNNERAEKYAQKAVIQDPKDYQAYHYLGIALDARSMHVEAERAFRKGLELWQGDPVPIMNNLALNLASQGFLEEASEILYKAKDIAPDRIEVERNIRIITALQQSGGDKPPKPYKKPRPL